MALEEPRPWRATVESVSHYGQLVKLSQSTPSIEALEEPRPWRATVESVSRYGQLVK